MALSKIDTTNMIEDVPQSKLDNNINFRNSIINGDMSVSQRSTSVSGITSGNGAYNTIDRYSIYMATAGTFTQSQSTDVPSGQGFSSSLKMDCTTANSSLSAGSYLHTQHAIEAQNLQYLKFGTSSAESLTLSFWVKSSKTGTYIVEFHHNDADKTISKSYTIDTASTWEKKIITIDGNTADIINNDNGIGISIWHWLVAGTNFTSGTLHSTWTTRVSANDAVGQVNLADSTSNEWYVTGVQLEVGETASDFEFLPVDVNLQRCKRYLFITDDKYYLNGQGGTNTSIANLVHVHQPELRAAPTVTRSTLTNGSFTSQSTNNKIMYRSYVSNSSASNSWYAAGFEWDAEL